MHVTAGLLAKAPCSLFCRQLSLLMRLDSLEGKQLRNLLAGGAWTIGYKAWGSLLGRRLSKHGVLCYCIDYRNFPQVWAACQPFVARRAP